MDLHMKKTSRILALLLSLVAVFSLFGCGSKDSGDSNDGSDSSDDGTVYTISWAHSSSTNDRLALATEKMAAELEEASNGRLKIEHYPASQLGAEREILEGVALGTIDCGIISSGVVAGFSNSVYVTNMPYLIDDREIGWSMTVSSARCSVRRPKKRAAGSSSAGAITACVCSPTPSTRSRPPLTWSA